MSRMGEFILHFHREIPMIAGYSQEELYNSLTFENSDCVS